MFDKYSSTRVEDFSIFLLDQILSQFDLMDISYENKKVIINKLPLEEIPEKIEVCLKQKHQGQYGNLDKEFQNKLNIKLLCYDLLNQPAREKQELVKKIIDEYDLKKKDIYGITFEESILKNLKYDIHTASGNLKRFLNNAGILYNKQKNRLLRRIVNDAEYKKAIVELNIIFNKHIDKAFKLYKGHD